MDIKDKVALVTGSSIGIGREVVLKLAKAGAKVVITCHETVKEAEAVMKECEKSTECLFVKSDMRKDKDIKDLVKKVIKKFGRLDILVNNAGIVRWKAFDKHTFEDFQNLTDTNLSGVMKLTLESLPHLKKAKDAIIINLASVAGKEPYGGLAAYCATKWGLRGFTQSLAVELPPHIRIHSINPGLTKTRMTDFEGDSVEDVAQVIMDTIKGKIEKKPGADIDIHDYI